MSKVVSLRGEAAGTEERAARIIEMCEEIIAAAKAGQAIGLAYTYVLPDHTCVYNWSVNGCGLTALGGAGLMLHAMREASE